MRRSVQSPENRGLLVAAGVQLGGWLLVGLAVLGRWHAGHGSDLPYRVLGGLGLAVALSAFLGGFVLRARQIRRRSRRRTGENPRRPEPGTMREE